MRKFYIILAVSLLLNFFLILLFAGQQIILSDKNKEIEALTQGKEQPKETKDDNAVSENYDKNTVKGFVKEFFLNQFNFDNNNYVSRFDKVKKYVSADVLSVLKGSGQTVAPKISFKNEVKDISIYVTSEDTKTIKVLVNIKILYSIQATPASTNNQIYQLELAKNKDSYIINKIDLMGSFAPYESK